MLLRDYNWKAHYSAHMTKSAEALGFCHYQIETDSGKGEVISCTVFPGVQAVYNDLRLLHCGAPVPRAESIVEISFCQEGRYECEVNSRYCFYLGHGDLSVGTVGRMETGGGFPTRRFCGLTLFLDLTALEKQYAHVLREMEIDLDMIRELSSRQPRRYVLHDSSEINAIFLSMTAAVRDHRLPMLKLYPLEGTYLAWIDARGLGLDAGALEQFLKKAGVRFNQGIEYGDAGAGFVRLNLATPRSLILEGLERIAAALA